MKSSMEKVAFAFAYLAALLKIDGRRKARIEVALRTRVRRPEPMNTARTAVMLPRAERRARIKELRKQAKGLRPEATKEQLRDEIVFRPVLGYVGAGALPTRGDMP